MTFAAERIPTGPGRTVRAPGGAVVELNGVGKRYEAQTLSLRGTKLELKGPALWARSLRQTLRSRAETEHPVEALVDVSLTLHSGEILALFGPNGSGKTTLLKILAGLLRPSAGSGHVTGVPLTDGTRIRRRVAYASTTGWMGLEWALTAEENLSYFGVLCGLSGREARVRAEEALRAVGLWADRKKLTSALSNGMRQRVILARSLLIRTPLVLLDEPTLGLDPDTRDRLLDYVRETLPNQGQAVLLADHQTDALDRVADRVVCLMNGRIVAYGTPLHLKARLGDVRVLDVITGEPSGDGNGLPLPDGILRAERTRRPGPLPEVRWRLMVRRAPDRLRRVLAWLEAQDLEVLAVTEAEPTLGDVLALAPLPGTEAHDA